MNVLLGCSAARRRISIIKSFYQDVSRTYHMLLKIFFPLTSNDIHGIKKIKNCAYSGEFIFCNKRKRLSSVLAAAVKWKMFQIGCGKWGNDFKWQPIPEKWTSLLMASFLEKSTFFMKRNTFFLLLVFHMPNVINKFFNRNNFTRKWGSNHPKLINIQKIW